MAHRKAGGSAKSLRDSKPKYLGVKAADGQSVTAGSIVVRQRGTRILPGDNVIVGRDHSLYSTVDGVVKFSSKRKKHIDGTIKRKPVANVTPQ